MAHSILVVDDSLPMRAVIKKMIRASGFGNARFFEAANGREALSVLTGEWVDLVVTDYNMPDMNGIELIGEMKKDEVFGDIPVIVITTEGSNEKVNAFREKGASAYLKKPFTPEEIHQTLVAILGDNHDEQCIDSGAETFDF